MVIGPDILDLEGNPMDQDQDSSGGEPDEDVFSVTLELQSPDLVVSSVAVSENSAVFGTDINVTWTVASIGPDPALESWIDRVWLSPNTELDYGDLLLAEWPPFPSVAGPLDGAGGATDSYTVTESILLQHTPGMVEGGYYILVETDALRTQPEANEFSNNVNFSGMLWITLDTAAIPEPSMTALLILGACGLGAYVRRRRKA